jgi:Fe2+ or Zn2+ uptake regulation protein
VSVYRVLTSLTEYGLAHRVGEGYTICRLGEHDGSTQHFICTSCFQTIEVPVSQELRNRADQDCQSLNFEISSVRLEVHGLCGDCRKK